MGHQIIKAPDGTYAVFSSFTDTWILSNASPQELEDYYAEKAAKDARRSFRDTLALVDENLRPYCQFTMTFAEANQASIKHGGLDLTKPDGGRPDDS
jgi:hypothetical protein